MPHADAQERREYHNEYYRKNKSKLDAYRREYRKNNEEKEKEWQDNYREASIEKRREYTLRSRYGLSIEACEELLIAQAGLCAICNKEISEKFNIDHNHTTGKVRGLLCTRCNTLLGKLGDSLDGLEKSFKKFKTYLEDNDE